MPRLSEPIWIGGVKVRNRIMLPPMATETATEKGEPTQKTLDHYMERASAGVGLVVMEHAYVMPEGRFSKHQMGIYSDELSWAYRDMVREIRSTGAQVALQLTHGGSATSPEITGHLPLGPSAVMHPAGHALPVELQPADIRDIVEAFVEAASRVKSLGFDMVMIHSAHGYLLSQFLSPITNKRDDDFGGNIESRARLLLTILKNARRHLEGYPFIVRLGIQDQYPEGVEPDPRFEGGLMLQEGVQVVSLLEQVGTELLDISGGFSGARPQGAPPAYFLPWQEAAKRATSIPVVATGGITESALACEILKQGKADMVGIGRAMLKNPFWASEALKTAEA